METTPEASKVNIVRYCIDNQQINDDIVSYLSSIGVKIDRWKNSGYTQCIDLFVKIIKHESLNILHIYHYVYGDDSWCFLDSVSNFCLTKQVFIPTHFRAFDAYAIKNVMTLTPEEFELQRVYF